MKAVGLVVIRGGVAEVFMPRHVDLRIVDMDNIIERGSEKAELPKDIGFEELVAEAGVADFVDYVEEE